MKRKRIVILLACAALLLGAVCFILLWPRESETLAAPDASAVLREKTQMLSSTVLRVTADDSLSVLSCTQETTYINQTGVTLDRVQLRLYPNAFKRASTTPLSGDTLSLGEAFVTGVRVNGRAAAWAVCESDETVLDVPVTLAPGASCALALDYTITLPDASWRLGQSAGAALYGNAFAHVAVYENGRFRDDAYGAIGDPFYADAQNITLHLTLPEGVTAAVGGALRAQEGSTYTYECLGVRDVSLALSRQYHVAQALHDGTLVSVYARSGKNARETLKTALNVLDLYEALFEYAYPYPTLTFAQGDLGVYGGMEYSAYAVIGDASYDTGGDALELIIAHEIAHQWFGVLVGSDPINEPWLDEAMSEYASLLYLEKAHGERAFEEYYARKIEPSLRITRPFGVTTGAPLSVFASMSEYAQTVYQRGAGMLHGIREAVGLEAFCDFVNLYVNRYAFSRVDRDGFAATLREATGSDWTGYLDDYLDD